MRFVDFCLVLVRHDYGRAFPDIRTARGTRALAENQAALVLPQGGISEQEATAISREGRDGVCQAFGRGTASLLRIRFQSRRYSQISLTGKVRSFRMSSSPRP